LISKDQLRSDLFQYLTGGLTGSERALFEERLLADQEFSDVVAVLEQEVIDDCAMGSLTAERAASIRSWVEASPRRMQRVKMARALLTSRSTARNRKLHLALTLAAAASILIAAGVTLRWFTKLPGKEFTTRSQATPPAKSVPPQAVPETGNSGRSAVILIVAERIRGEQPIATYRIRPDVPVELQILLAGAAVHSTYDLEIVSLDSKQQVILKQEDLQPRVEAGQSYLDASFPPGSLSSATYKVTVSDGRTTLQTQFTVTK
jgi:hypothetical protein